MATSAPHTHTLFGPSQPSRPQQPARRRTSTWFDRFWPSAMWMASQPSLAVNVSPSETKRHPTGTKGARSAVHVASAAPRKRRVGSAGRADFRGWPTAIGMRLEPKERTRVSSTSSSSETGADNISISRDAALLLNEILVRASDDGAIRPYDSSEQRALSDLMVRSRGSSSVDASHVSDPGARHRLGLS